MRYVYGTQEAEDALHIRWSWDTAFNGLRHDGDDSNQTMTGGDRRDVMFAWGGDDTLTGTNAFNDYYVTGPDSGTLYDLGSPVNFLRTENIQGATGQDNIHFVEGGSLSGWVRSSTLMAAARRTGARTASRGLSASACA